MFKINVFGNKNIGLNLKNYLNPGVFLKCSYFLFSFLVSHGVILGKYYPFGVALSGAVSSENSLSVMLGAICGYFFLGRFSKGIEYISVMFMVTTFKWILSGATKLNNNKFFLPTICFISSVCVSVFVSYPENLNFWYIYGILLDATILAVFSYCFERAFATFKNPECLITEKQNALYTFLILFSIFSSLLNVKIYRFSIGKILLTTATVFSVYCYGGYGGSLVGAVAGAVAGFSQAGVSFFSGLYSLGGIISGLLFKGKKLGACLTFLVLSIAILFNSSVSTVIFFETLFELLIGVIIFLFIPTRVINYINAVIKIFYKNYKNKGTKNFKCTQINYLPSKIDAIPSLENNTAVEDNFCNKENEFICDYDKPIKDDVIYQKNEEEYVDNFSKIVLKILKDVTRLNSKFEHSRNFKKNDEIISNIRKSIDDFADGFEAKSRAKELYSEIYEKISFAEALLGCANEEVKINDMENIVKSREIKNFLSENDIDTVRTECRINSCGRIFVEIEVMNTDNKYLIDGRILERISWICETQLNKPIVFNTENRTIIRISEKEKFDINIYVSKHNCNNGKLCGDCCSYFKDGTGKFSVVISDGMGTGGRAAADGAVTAGIIERLIKLRVEPKSAIKIANLSISGKGSRESLAAIDIMTLDLYSGMAEFVKAGAPVTLILRRGEVKRVETLSSLPIGIFDDVNMSLSKVELCDADVVIMMSDGVTDLGVDWIEEKLTGTVNIDIQRLSDYILKESLARRDENHDDDITVAVINILRRYDNRD